MANEGLREALLKAFGTLEPVNQEQVILELPPTRLPPSVLFPESFAIPPELRYSATMPATSVMQDSDDEKQGEEAKAVRKLQDIARDITASQESKKSRS